MQDRVVITGLGVVAPNGTSLSSFEQSLRQGISGIRFNPQLEALNFSCQLAGQPSLEEERIHEYFSPLELRNFNSSGILYGVIAGMDAWRDAGLEPAPKDCPFWDYGTIFGAGTSGIEKLRESVDKLDSGQVRKLGSSAVIQTMNSGVSAYLSGKLGFGNIVTTNSSACSTGTESILLAYDRIKSGQAKVILAGSTSDSGPYIWGGFDAMKVCTYKNNDRPEEGSRPMSASASGFVPGSGAGALVLESYAHAKARNAPIYAEVAGGCLNSGGQRGSGTMTAPNSIAVQQCIRQALHFSGIRAADVDTINGHLTATMMDSTEIANWATALNREGLDFPYINSLKSLVGHCLSASGSIESVASVLQVKNDFIFGNKNAEDLHPAIEQLISPEKVPQKTIQHPVNVLMKASFGFGDVNACVIFKKFNSY